MSQTHNSIVDAKVDNDYQDEKRPGHDLTQAIARLQLRNQPWSDNAYRPAFNRTLPGRRTLDPWEQYKLDRRPVYRTYMPEFDRLNEIGASFAERAEIFNRRALDHRAAIEARELPKPMRGEIQQSWQRQRKANALVAAWEAYFGPDVEASWIRLCRDLHVQGDLRTKEDCKIALRALWVNICDFLWIKKEVCFFATEQELSVYSIATGKIYPRWKVKRGSALECLIIKMYGPKKEPIKVRDKTGKLIRVLPRVPACRTWTLEDNDWRIQRHVSKKELEACSKVAALNNHARQD